MTGAWLADFGIGGVGAGGHWPMLAAVLGSALQPAARVVQGAVALGATGVLWRERRHVQALRAARRSDELRRRELLAYLLLEIPEDCLQCAAFAKAVCQLISVRSAFQSAALLRVDDEGGLFVTGSVGMDDLSLQAMERWKASELTDLLREEPEAGEHSARLLLERRRSGYGDAATRLRCEEVIVVPMQQAHGLAGVLVVGEPAGKRAGGGTGAAQDGELMALEALALRMLKRSMRADEAVERPQRKTRAQGARRAGTHEGERSRPNHRRTLDTVAPGDGGLRREATLRRLIEATAPPGFALPVRTPDRVRGYCPTRM